VRHERDIINEIMETYTALSPEWLSCDGELPAAKVRQRRIALDKKLKGLFKELGREISEIETYNIIKSWSQPRSEW
jgi:hypothetical protein